MDEKRLDELNQEYKSLLDEYTKEIESNRDHQTSKSLAIHNELMRKHQAITELLPNKTNA